MNKIVEFILPFIAVAIIGGIIWAVVYGWWYIGGGREEKAYKYLQRAEMHLANCDFQESYYFCKLSAEHGNQNARHILADWPNLLHQEGIRQLEEATLAERSGMQQEASFIRLRGNKLLQEARRLGCTLKIPEQEPVRSPDCFKE